jgi:UDP:flavonoid glycosyltransferase YjiC (YdhE family)
MPPAAKTFVLYPSLGVGHLNPMVELAKHLLRHGHTVVIAVVDPPDTDAVSADAVARLAAANPSIAYQLRTRSNRALTRSASPTWCSVTSSPLRRRASA